MNWKVFLKCPVILWIKWLIDYLKLKRKYPTVKLELNAKVYNSQLGKYVTIYNNSLINQCVLGDYTYIANDSNFSNTSIGKFCSIGPGVRCGMGVHPSKQFVSTHPIFFSNLKQAQISFADKSYFEELKPIKIGNDVWIGANAVILDGVNIGDGAIIGAGAVVNKDVPPYAIVGGVPAKIIRYRFTEKQIEFLLQDQWWNKPEEWLRKNYKIMHNSDEYIAHFKSIEKKDKQNI